MNIVPGLFGAIVCCTACGSGSAPPTSAAPFDPAAGVASSLSNELGIAALVPGDQADSARPGRVLQMELVATDPEQQRKGQNAFTVRFSNLNGDPYEPATATAIPWMPNHGHGTAVPARVHPGLNAGEWVLDDLNLFMASYWKVYVFVCALPEAHCCDANAEPCDETSDSLVDTLFFKAWIPS